MMSRGEHSHYLFRHYWEGGDAWAGECHANGGVSQDNISGATRHGYGGTTDSARSGNPNFGVQGCNRTNRYSNGVVSDAVYTGSGIGNHTHPINTQAAVHGNYHPSQVIYFIMRLEGYQQINFS